MASSQRPFLYEGEDGKDSRFPMAIFDPKAVTRASYYREEEEEEKAIKKKTRPADDGPLVSINRHPDAHDVARAPRIIKCEPMSPGTKNRIKSVRGMQFVLRLFSMFGGIGVLVLMILLQNVESLTAWVMRVTGGLVAMTSFYALVHLGRPAKCKTPASASAYHCAAAVSDVSVMVMYTYGILSVRKSGSSWTTLLTDQGGLAYHLVAAFYYTLMGAGALHTVSFAASLYLGVMFRRITLMPPDMNPLEDNLTSRHTAPRRLFHAYNMSLATMSTDEHSDSKRFSTATLAAAERKRLSAPGPARGAYAGLPPTTTMHRDSPRASTGTVASYRASPTIEPATGRAFPESAARFDVAAGMTWHEDDSACWRLDPEEARRISMAGNTPPPPPRHRDALAAGTAYEALHYDDEDDHDDHDDNGSSCSEHEDTGHAYHPTVSHAQGHSSPDPHNRPSSIQPERAFHSKPYGDVAPPAPPAIMSSPSGSIRQNDIGSPKASRQVSSGTDYFERKLALTNGSWFARRNASGRVAEEGRAVHDVENRWLMY